MTISNTKHKRKTPRRRPLTLETCEQRYLLAADLFPSLTDRIATFDNIGTFSNASQSEFVDISEDIFLDREFGLTNTALNQNSRDAAFSGNDVLYAIRVDSHFYFDDAIYLESTQAIDGDDFIPWLRAPTETSVELEAQSTPVESQNESRNDRQLSISDAAKTANIDTSLPREIFNNYSPPVGNALNFGTQIDTLSPPSQSYRLQSITENDLNSSRDTHTTVTSHMNTFARRQGDNYRAETLSRYQIDASVVTIDLDSIDATASSFTTDVLTILNDHGANSVADTFSEAFRDDPSVQLNGMTAATRGPEFPRQPTENLAEPHDRHEANVPKMVDITHTLGEQGRREPTTGSHTRIVNVTFEPSLALTSNYRVISTSRVQAPRRNATGSVFVTHPPHGSNSTALGPHQYASRSRAQAFEFVDRASLEVNSVSLAGVFDPLAYQSSESTWTRYIPAHVPVPTLHLVFDMALLQERELSRVDPNDMTNPPLQPTAATQPHRASSVDIDEQDDQSRTDRRAATMVFSVLAVQQLWRYDRRKHRLAASLGEVVHCGLQHVLTLVELPAAWWSSFNHRRKEGKATRRVPRPIFPAVNFRGDRRR